MTDRQRVLDELTKPFPRQAIEKKGKFDYVSGETVIYRLNAATNYDWGFRVTGHELVGGANTQGNKPALVIYGEMCIPIISPLWRADMGTQLLENMPDDHEAHKGAVTDCIKRCARLFGVGLHLWGPDIEAGEIAHQRPAPQAPQQRPAQMPPPPRPTNGNGQSYPQPATPQQVSQAQMLDPNAPATDRQKEFIIGLAKQLGMVSDNDHHDPQALDAEVRQLTKGGAMQSLTKGQASLVIEEFKGRPKPVTR